MNDTTTAAARDSANAAHRLAQAAFDALNPDEQAEVDRLVSDGAVVAATVKWSAERVEVRVGLVNDDQQSQSVLFAFDFPKPAGEAGLRH